MQRMNENAIANLEEKTQGETEEKFVSLCLCLLVNQVKTTERIGINME